MHRKAKASAQQPAPEAAAQVPPRRDVNVVLLVVSNLEYGGAQRQVIELANAMPSDGCRVHVCSLSNHVPLAERLHHRESRLHIIPKRWKYDMSVVWRLARLLRRVQADIVHGFLFDAELAARLAGRLAGTRLIVGSERNAEYHLSRCHRIAYRLTRSFADAIIANSHAGAAFHQRTRGHPPSHYRVVHNGIDTDRFRPRSGDRARQSLGIPVGDFVIGMFAGFKPQKNHGLAFAAFRQVLDRLPNARLLLVGDELHLGLRGSTAYKRDMCRLVETLGIGSRCSFLGNRGDPEELYCACDMTLLPSHHEGTPNVLLESMACGVPVVATDVSDNAIIVPNENVGFIVPPGDEAALAGAILKMAADIDARARMGHEARRWIESQFTNAVLAGKTLAAYRDYLTRRDADAAQNTEPALAGARPESQRQSCAY